MMPVRVQLKRTKGYKKPPECVSVVRPGVLGNPFTVKGYLDVWDRKATPEEAARGCVGMYRDWIAGRLHTLEERRQKVLALLPSLRGKDLACWCKPEAACHADVLLELANMRMCYSNLRTCGCVTRTCEHADVLLELANREA